MSAEPHCSESVNIPAAGEGIFRATAGGFAIIHALLIRVFGSEDVKNIRGYFYVKLDRMRKAYNREEDVNKYHKEGNRFHGNLPLITYFFLKRYVISGRLSIKVAAIHMKNKFFISEAGTTSSFSESVKPERSIADEQMAASSQMGLYRLYLSSPDIFLDLNGKEDHGRQCEGEH